MMIVSRFRAEDEQVTVKLDDQGVGLVEEGSPGVSTCCQ